VRNEHTLDAILTALTQNCGDTLAACRSIGVSLMFLNQWCKDDTQVRERVEEATQVGAQGLVSEAIRRAVTGIDEPVYYKGVQTDSKRVYSDSLLALLLKAKGGNDFKGEASGPTSVQVNIANLMPRATSYEEWLAMKDQTIIDGQANVVPMRALAHVVMGPEEVLPDLLEEHAPFKGIEL
jgi:DNA-binding transcriptional regulator YdaS (Cro superfamily)